MVIRILTPFIAHSQMDTPLPPTVINAVGIPNAPIVYKNVQQQSTIDIIKQIGEEGAVLLQNKGGLPLKAPQQIAIIGTGAGPNVLGYQACGSDGDGCPIDNNNGTFSIGLGSGFSQPQNLITPLTTITMRALQDRSLVQSVLNNSAFDDMGTTASTADVAIVFVEAFAEENQDRSTLNLTAGGNEMIQAVAAVCNNTVVIMHIPGPVIIDSWVNHPNITAILAPLLPGEQTGPSLVSLLYGDVSPSGKLPFTSRSSSGYSRIYNCQFGFTVAKQESDYPPDTIVTTPIVNPQANFTEGLGIDYRWFDTNNITPQYGW